MWSQLLAERGLMPWLLAQAPRAETLTAEISLCNSRRFN
jgi:hypothetical protein